MFSLALADPAGLMLIAGLLLLLLAAWAVGVLLAQRGGTPSFPLTYARRTAFLRQRDPDAAGRPRPRAPSPHFS
ncbi:MULTISPECIES: DUF6412 domain-containing protein [unclassified Nonomuraea]|uniref:DUF6412 domain-containing protein n=1 Tax=Nonomuraea sp. NPDC003804 TaxID=3154547 RepID=UPI0033BC241A